jgi:hypothetical protein
VFRVIVEIQYCGQEFDTEMRIWTKLTHSNVLHFFGVCTLVDVNIALVSSLQIVALLPDGLIWLGVTVV